MAGAFAVLDAVRTPEGAEELASAILELNAAAAASGGCPEAKGQVDALLGCLSSVIPSKDSGGDGPKERLLEERVVGPVTRVALDESPFSVALSYNPSGGSADVCLSVHGTILEMGKFHDVQEARVQAIHCIKENAMILIALAERLERTSFF